MIYFLHYIGIFMGAREGQQVTVVAPAGEIQYTVDKIER